MTIIDTSKATATRDLQELVEKGIFAPTDGGRSTRYQISRQPRSYGAEWNPLHNKIEQASDALS